MANFACCSGSDGTLALSGCMLSPNSPLVSQPGYVGGRAPGLARRAQARSFLAASPAEDGDSGREADVLVLARQETFLQGLTRVSLTVAQKCV